MKKLLAMILLAVVTLTACSSVPKAGMFIKPSEFSKETQKVLSLFDNEIQFFDITLDETAKSQTISIWVYHDGVWIEDGKTSGGIESQNGQIALRLTNSSCDIYSIVESGHMKYSYPVLETEFKKSTAISSSKIDNMTSIELNKEIPIWVKTGTDKNSMKIIGSGEDFRSSDCNAGIAITLTISDEVVE